jgi:flagellar biosynthesis GTPase FlhF
MKNLALAGDSRKDYILLALSGNQPVLELTIKRLRRFEFPKVIFTSFPSVI